MLRAATGACELLTLTLTLTLTLALTLTLTLTLTLNKRLRAASGREEPQPTGRVVTDIVCLKGPGLTREHLVGQHT